MAPPDPTLKLVGAERSMTQWLAYYVIAVFGVAVFFTGSVVSILFLIGTSEILLMLWRPTPKLGPASYSAPTPDALRAPILAMRWYEILTGCWSIGCIGVIVTGLLGLFIAAMRPSSLGPSHYAILVIVGGWLATRPLWAPRLKKWARRETASIGRQLSGGSPIVRVGTEGVDVDLNMRVIGGSPPQRSWIFSVGFAELSEVRTLGPNDAQAYWQSMEQYDPSIDLRTAWEFSQFIAAKIPRPSMLQQVSFGEHLLMRGPNVLYLLGNGDEFGPAAVAAWQAWQSSHAVPTTPSA